MGRRFGRSVALLVLTLCCAGLALPSSSSGAAVTRVPDPERNSSQVTPWGWHGDATVAEIQEYVGAGNRIVDFEVNSSAPTFSVSYVKNAGVYARTWWWLPGATVAEIAEFVDANNARLIDVEPYDNGDEVRYAAVMVANTGASFKNWGWYPNEKLSVINKYVDDNKMRTVDIDRVPGGNFSALVIRNSGVDAKSWWQYYDITATQLNKYLNDNKARPLIVDRRANGNFDVVMQARSGEYWNHVYGLTADQLTQATNQLGMRIFQLKSRVVNGVRRYDALLINNVNAETTRIRQLVQNKMKGKWGFYLKKVGGAELAALGEEIVFEPASMIKIVHAVRAMRDIQFDPLVNENTLVTWYAHPDAPARYPSDPNYRKDDNNADVCPYDDDGNLITTNGYEDALGPVVVKQTMKYSDNRTTDALTSLYGFDELNLLMAGAGMAKSSLNHRINCFGALDQPQPVGANRLTLRDAAKLYEQVQDGSLLDSTHRDLLYSYMVSGTVAGSFRATLDDTLQQAGLTATERGNFLNLVESTSKGGSYTNCTNHSCHLVARTQGGVLEIPFKSATKQIVRVPYVFGKYFEASMDCSKDSIDKELCPAYIHASRGMDTIMLAMMRTQVKKAAKTWVANR